MNYYNENNPQKAEWLRQLIERNVISKGEVDERSIEEVGAGELRGYRQCHFFAGIGIWSFALRLAGWSDDREVWTGSCPCQPWSVAGEGKGAEDERHLWPAWFRLITERRPRVVFGEQVADGDGITWLDNVQTQLETISYRVGPCVLPASGFGAPHGRHRTYFVADAEVAGCAVGEHAGEVGGEEGEGRRLRGIAGHSEAGELADAAVERSRPMANGSDRETIPDAGWNGAVKRMDDTPGCGQPRSNGTREQQQRAGSRCEESRLDDTQRAGLEVGSGRCQDSGTSKGSSTAVVASGVKLPVNGFWIDAEWVPTRGKVPGAVEWRPIKSGSFEMVDGTAGDLLRVCNYGFPLTKKAEARTMRLKGYGDGIVAQVAAAFIKAYMEL